MTSALAAESVNWVPGNGGIPAGAISGDTEGGRPLAVCRANYQGGVHPGKVVTGNCNIGWGGREITIATYEVLVGNASWGPARPGLSGAVMGGSERGNGIAVCRALFNGVRHPGKVVSGNCNIGWGGKEQVLQNFEVLYAAAGSAAAPPTPMPVMPPIAQAQPQQTAQPTQPNQQSALNSGLQTANRVLYGEQEPDICWKDSYGRGAGQVPDVCKPGFERTGADLLCYPKCQAGYNGVGPVCWQDCPAGFRNDGAFCAKPAAYGRGTGYAYNIFTEGRSAAQARCERDHGTGNCERNLEMFYPICKTGFKEFGSNICTPVCPAGMADIGASCSKKSYGRTAGEGGACGPGFEQDFKGGLCYPTCRAGTNGVGPVCWNSCPKNFPVNCGAACGVSQSACAFAIIDQVQSSAELALNVAALVASAGTASAELRMAETAGRQARTQLTRAARQQLEQQAQREIKNVLAAQARKQSVENAGKWLGRAENVNTAAKLLVDAKENGQFDFTSLVPTSVADAEPTGILAVVRSFNKPICGK
jgi:hypothetical protein